MPFHTKTIVCKPLDFDLNFENWNKEITKKMSSYEFINKIVIAHDGDNHYILYSLNVSLPKNTM